MLNVVNNKKALSLTPHRNRDVKGSFGGFFETKSGKLLESNALWQDAPRRNKGLFWTPNQCLVIDKYSTPVPSLFPHFCRASAITCAGLRSCFEATNESFSNRKRALADKSG